MEDINKQRRSFISLSELEYGPLEFNLSEKGSLTFGKVRKYE